jgi:nucleoid-associated protein YgaU
MTTEHDKREGSDTREVVREQAAQMSPASRADFVDTSSHAAATLDRTMIHVVAEADTLRTIAMHYYGNENAGMLIFDANRDQLTDPDRIKPGQMLKIPAKP